MWDPDAAGGHAWWIRPSRARALSRRAACGGRDPRLGRHVVCNSRASSSAPLLVRAPTWQHCCCGRRCTIVQTRYCTLPQRRAAVPEGRPLCRAGHCAREIVNSLVVVREGGERRDGCVAGLPLLVLCCVAWVGACGAGGPALVAGSRVRSFDRALRGPPGKTSHRLRWGGPAWWTRTWLGSRAWRRQPSLARATFCSVAGWRGCVRRA